MPTCSAIALAVRSLSPVIIIQFSPALFKALIASLLSSFKVSATAMMPASLPSAATRTVVLPSFSRLLSLDSASSTVIPALAAVFCFHKHFFTSGDSPDTKSRQGGEFINLAGIQFLSSAARTIACPRGCSEAVSTPAASVRSSFSITLSRGIISVTTGSPLVIVPVLSKIIVSTFNSVRGLRHP